MRVGRRPGTLAIFLLAQLGFSFSADAQNIVTNTLNGPFSLHIDPDGEVSSKRLPQGYYPNLAPLEPNNQAPNLSPAQPSSFLAHPSSANSNEAAGQADAEKAQTPETVVCECHCPQSPLSSSTPLHSPGAASPTAGPEQYGGDNGAPYDPNQEP